MNEHLGLIREALLELDKEKADKERLSYILNELRKIQRFNESTKGMSRKKLKSILISIYDSMNEAEQNKFNFKDISQEYVERILDNTTKNSRLIT